MRVRGLLHVAVFKANSAVYKESQQFFQGTPIFLVKI